MQEEPVKPQEKPREPIFGGDKHIWGIYIALCLISIVELYSASSREVAASTIGVYGPILRHFMLLAIGFMVVVGIQRIHYGRFAKVIPFFMIISVVMMIYVLLFEKSTNGATRAINTPLLSVQPSEFLKISAVAFIALVMSLTQSERDNKMRTYGVWVTSIAVIIFAALMISDGFTNTMILMAISLAMMLIGGIRVKQFLIVLAVYGAFGGCYWGFQKVMADKHQDVGRYETRSNRIATFANDSVPKWERPLNKDNLQETYSYMAQANGGVIGVFPGNSRETTRLPLAFSDFIYSIVVEDMGLIGGILVLVLFLWLLARASGIASRCRNYYSMLLVIGMAVFIVTQALTHMAIVTGVVPVSGQPLPLISKGGTSIIITSLAFGIMLSVSRYATRTSKRKAKTEPEDTELLPENMRGANPSQLGE